MVADKPLLPGEIGDVFWMVYDPAWTQTMPRVRFHSYDDAERVAREVLKKNASAHVFVMRSFAMLEPYSPPVKVTAL